jgi:hypothetical protein
VLAPYTDNAAQVREIPGVDLTRLPASRRGEALLALNAEACTCGCGLTVARCDHDTNLGRPAEGGTEVRSREVRLASG